MTRRCGSRELAGLLVVEESRSQKTKHVNVQLDEMKLIKLSDAGVSLLACFSSPASRACTNM